MNKNQLKKNLHSRVRLVPPAKREHHLSGSPLPTLDDEWIIREITDETLTLHNPRTGHNPILGLDQIASWTNDPGRNIGAGKHGFLRLHVQLTLKGREVKTELLNRAEYYSHT